MMTYYIINDWGNSFLYMENGNLIQVAQGETMQQAIDHFYSHKKIALIQNAEPPSPKPIESHP